MAANVRVDLRAPRVNLNTNIWIAHSGRNRQLLDFFEESKVVVLEYPGLDLRANILGNDNAIRQRLRMSQAIRANKGLVRDDGTPIRLGDFPGYADKDVAVALRTVRHLTERMRPGDLVVAPGKGAEGRVLFGEVAGEFNPDLRVRSPSMPFADVPARNVRWVAAEQYKRNLPAQLQKFFEKPPAIAQVPRNDLSDRFFEYAYDSYVSDRVAWAMIDAPTYDGRDLRSTTDPTSLIIFALSIYRAVESGVAFNDLSYDDIIDTYYDVSDFERLGVSYNSPGKYAAKTRDVLLALFVSAFVGLAAAGALSSCSEAGATVTVVNSEAPNDATTGEIDRMINLASQNAGGAALSTADRRGARAHANVDLRAPAAVNVQRPKP